MNKYNPNIHNRRSIRLKGYDYSKAGLYFITICVQDRRCLFGRVVDGKMMLNEAGIMVENWYWELQNKYADIQCHEMVVMPNHFHCILENVGIVGADLCVCPKSNLCVCRNNMVLLGEQTGILGRHIGLPPQNENNILGEHAGSGIMGEHAGSGIMGEHAGSPLSRVVQWFKTMSTNAYIRGVKTNAWPSFNKKLWQRNYWEHIIRNEKSYQRISNYIVQNPLKWSNDNFYDA